MSDFEELKEWIRERMVEQGVGCHVLTLLIREGKECKCPLCLLDNVAAADACRRHEHVWLPSDDGVVQQSQCGIYRGVPPDKSPVSTP